ncbi:MAG: (Fe-S)-binding protein [Dehalococcoidia bacterium]|nr:(Fe-S)-binding protein [Dehalococcoidia bacterium]
MSANLAIFTAFLVVALAFFSWSCFRRFRLVFLGRRENRFGNPGERIRGTVLHAFGQRCAVSHDYRFGLNHLVLFWCFLILLIANTEFLLHGLAPGYISFSRLPDTAYFTLSSVFDILSALALLAVLTALVRRLFFAPSYLEARTRDAFTILTLVALLMIAYLGLHASEISQGVERAARYMPVSNLVSSTFFSGIPATGLDGAINAFWWIHAIVLLGFLNYLPYSKHMHILTSIPNCFFRSLTKVNTQAREAFEKGRTFGVGQIDQFTWKGLFDSYSCTECGRCSDVCPATFTGKRLNPRLVIRDIKENLLENGPLLYRKNEAALPLIGDQKGSVSEEVIWDCTTCGACMEVCPVFIEHVPRIIDMRRNLVEMQARFPEELLTLFANIEQRGNPWGIAPAALSRWAVEINAPSFEAGKTEYLFYVGCDGAFDARSRDTILSVARILDAGGVSWGVLDREHICCGDSLRRLGNEFVFDRMVEDNAKFLEKKGVKRIITQCPHCYSTLKNDYRQYGVELEVIHHTEIISDLIASGRLEINRTQEPGKVVFHDSCYLGRLNMIYDAPRKALVAVTGRSPVEMDRHHGKSFCCGAGGGHMWMEEKTGKGINIARVEEALEKDAETICVCCPYCMTMFEDALKYKNAVSTTRVMDLAEIVANSLMPARSIEPRAVSGVTGDQ